MAYLGDERRYARRSNDLVVLRSVEYRSKSVDYFAGIRENLQQLLLIHMDSSR